MSEQDQNPPQPIGENLEAATHFEGDDRAKEAALKYAAFEYDALQEMRDEVIARLEAGEDTPELRAELASLNQSLLSAKADEVDRTHEQGDTTS